jgi:3-hydroxyisobutyrate dehydrogenase-like beta-hydroxyacid dehydrogenase
MRKEGADIVVYDKLFEEEEKAFKKKKLAHEIDVNTGTLRTLLDKSSIILSTVTTQEASNVATTCAPMLRPKQIFVDLNSTSPRKKMEISRIIQNSKAVFVEGAILEAIGTAGSKTRILIGGPAGENIANTLNKYGLNAIFYSQQIGKASAFKMFRSIFTKGVEALLLEMLVAGRRAGIEEDLWEDVTRLMKSRPFDEIAKNWILTHATANERRYHEMLQVLEAMNEIGIKPLIAEGTTSYFKQSVDFELSKAFASKPSTINELVDFIEAKLPQNQKA